LKLSRRRSIVLEVNKDEGAGLVGTYKLYVRSLSAVGMAEETEAPLVDAETEEEEELRRVSQTRHLY
jgi:hypothetical protein